jgi:hypothetical protein
MKKLAGPHPTNQPTIRGQGEQILNSYPLFLACFHLTCSFNAIVFTGNLVEMLVPALLILRQWDRSHGSQNGLLTAKLVGHEIYNSPS